MIFYRLQLQRSPITLFLSEPCYKVLDLVSWMVDLQSRDQNLDHAHQRLWGLVV